MISGPLKEWQIGSADKKGPAAEETEAYNDARREGMNNSVLRFVAAFTARLVAAMNTNNHGLSTFEMVGALESKRNVTDAIAKGGNEWTPETAANELMDTVNVFTRHMNLRGRRAITVDALKSIQPIRI